MIAADLSPVSRKAEFRLGTAEQLAMNYAPQRWHATYLALFALDARLRRIVAQAREPMLAQVKLAWWREQIDGSPSATVAGEPLLTLIASTWANGRDVLSGLVEGYEWLLYNEAQDRPEVPLLVEQHASAFAELAHIIGYADEERQVRIAVKPWSLVTVLSLMSGDRERQKLLEASAASPPLEARLSRPLRPVAVLSALARRSLAAGGGPLVVGPASIAAALKAGLLGR